MTERKRKNEAEFIPRAFPSESPSNNKKKCIYIYALEAFLLGHTFVLKPQISAGQLSADSSSTETLSFNYSSPLNFLRF